MALKPCRECGSQVSSNAESCPQCGEKVKKIVPRWVVWLIFISVFAVIVNSCSEKALKNKPNEAAASLNLNQENNPVVVQNWEYKTTTDEMRGVKTKFATTVSSNTVNFDFPYNGGSKLILTLRQSGNEVDVIVKVSKGQILCGVSGCEAAFKFDDGAVQMVTMAEPDNYASDVLFVMYDKTENQIISKLKTSNKLVIEVPFFQEGKKQFTFDVSGLKWN